MIATRIGAQARRLIALGILTLCAQAPCWGQLEQSDRDRLFQSIHDSHQQINAADWVGCLAHLDKTATLAHRAWTQTSLSWFSIRTRCEASDLKSRGQPVTAETMTQLTAPVLAHLAHMPPGADSPTGARMLVLNGKWRWMALLGLGREAEQEELQTVRALLERVESGQDAVAREEADRWANGLYGQHDLLAQIQAHLRWISERHGQGHRAALILRRAVSFAYRSADRNAEALAVMDEARQLALQHHAGDQDLQMLIAGERAPCLAANGLWLEARDEFIALRDWMLANKPSGHGNLMRMNYHLAAIANMLGDHEQAEAYADAADQHARQSSLPNDRFEVAVAHLQRAEARLLRGVPGAVDEVRRELERNSPGDGGTGAPAFGLAKLARRTGDTELLAWAQAFLDRHAYERLQPMQPARALVDLAAAWSASGRDPARSRALLDRALVRSLSDRDPAVSVQGAFAMARQLAPTQPDVAVWWFKRGANALQALRQRGHTAQDDSMHRATLADHEADLREFITLLIDQGRYLEARDAVRVLREEELHDFARRSRQRAAAARTGALALTARERLYERALQPLVERMRTEQEQADARAKPAPLVFRGRGWLDDPVTDAVLERSQGELHTMLDRLETRARPQGAEADCSRPAGRSRRPCDGGASGHGPALRGRLSANTARLQYLVHQNRLDILVTTASGWHRHSVPIPQVELNRRVHAWRAALINPEADAMKGAQAFFALLIKPVQARLGRASELRIALDGALRYLPMAALHDGTRYLVQRHHVVMDDGLESRGGKAAAGTVSAEGNGPAANLGRPGRRTAHRPGAPTTAGLQLAAFGRVAADDDHAALPGVEAELAALAALRRGPHDQREGVQVLQDAAFTAQALHATVAAGPRVVHIASHFHLAAADEESSYLLLGDGQRLPLAGLAQMPWGRVRLVLLSGCETAVGESPRHGREFNGLAGVLRQAGVGSVIASLWPIADGSTASFMREFYRPWAVPHAVGPHAARHRRNGALAAPDSWWLTLAQRRWLARHPSDSLAHPYHWAAFVWGGGT